MSFNVSTSLFNFLSYFNTSCLVYSFYPVSFCGCNRNSKCLFGIREYEGKQYEIGLIVAELTEIRRLRKIQDKKERKSNHVVCIGKKERKWYNEN